MIHDFTINKVLSLSNIKRCGIIDTSKEQSVAEHSYNVAMICIEIFNRVPKEDVEYAMRQNVIEFALAHDLSEIVTGDIPTPFKKELGDAMKKVEQSLFPKITLHKESLTELEVDILKAADLIDAVRFIGKYGMGSEIPNIVNEILDNLRICVKKIKGSYGKAVYGVAIEVIGDTFSLLDPKIRAMYSFGGEEK